MFGFAIATFSQDMELLRGIPVGEALRECGAFLGDTTDVIRERAVDLFENGRRMQEGTHANVFREGDVVYKFYRMGLGEEWNLIAHNELFAERYGYAFVGVSVCEGQWCFWVSQKYVKFRRDGGEKAKLLLMLDLEKRFGESKRLKTETRDEIVAGDWYLDDLKEVQVGIEETTGAYAVVDCIIHKAQDVPCFAEDVRLKGRTVADEIRSESNLTMQDACSHANVARCFQIHYASQDVGHNYGDLCYHYTSPEVFELLLRDDADLMCTLYSSLNDTSEYQLGAEVVFDYMVERAWNSQLRHFLESRHESFKKGQLFLPWITSFTCLNDSLYQWNSYTDKQAGGYAIGIDRRILQAYCAEVGRRNAQDKAYPYVIMLHNCLYVGLDEYYQAFDSVFGRIRGLDTKNAVINEKVAAQVNSWILFLAAIVKPKWFFNEDETRLILQYNGGVELASEQRVVGGKPRVPSHFGDYVGVLREAISCVIISPHGDRLALRRRAETLRNQCNADFAIVDSVISYATARDGIQKSNEQTSSVAV